MGQIKNIKLHIVTDIKSRFAMAMNKKYDDDMESAVLDWMSDVMGNKDLFAGVKGPDKLKEKLLDGTILCEFMNKLLGDDKAIEYTKQFNKTTKAFKQRENVEKFNQKMKDYPKFKPEYVFVVDDLVKGKNLPGVLIGLRE